MKSTQRLTVALAIAALPATFAPALAESVTMLTDFLVNGNHTPYFAGVAQGKFRDVGLEVTVQPGKSSLDASGQVAAGAAQFAVLDPTTALLAVDKGANLSFVATYFQRNQAAICYLKSKRALSKVDDVVALSIGSNPGDAVLVALKAMLPGKNLNVVTMEAASYNPAVISGRVDAIPCTVGTFPVRAAVAKQAGQEMGIITLADSGLKSLGLVVVVATPTVKQKPDTVKRFVQGFAESVAWSVANPKAAVDDLIKAQPDLKADTTMATFQAIQPFLSVPGREWFKLDSDAAKATVDFANKAYGIKATVTVFDNQFANVLPAHLLQGKP